MTTIPELALNNGVQIPAIGWGIPGDPGGDHRVPWRLLWQRGYRHIDTAASYGNEREVGEAIRRSGVDRAEVFIETKVWISDYGYDETLHAFDKSAAQAGRRADRPADPPPAAADRV